MYIHSIVAFDPPQPGLIPDDDLQNFYSREAPTYRSSSTQIGPHTLKRGPHKMQIHPLSNQYYKDDVINCQVTGNSTPLIEWSVDGVCISNSSSLVITSDMAGTNKTVACIATNDFEGWNIYGFLVEPILVTIIGTPAPQKSKFYTWPTNQAVQTGDIVIMNCSAVSIDILYWAVQLEGSQTENNVAHDGQIIPGYEDQYGLTSDGNLVIFSAVAQRVKCGLISGSVSMHSHIITVDPAPTCGHNITNVNETHNGQGVHLYCEMSYNGLWRPVMTWGTMETEGDRWDLAPLAVNESSGNVVRYSLYLTLGPQHDLTVFMCKTHFLPPPGGVLPDDDVNTISNRHAPTWTHYYKSKRFYVN